MRIRVNGKDYDVRFSTFYREDEFGRIAGPLRDTSCFISSVDDSKRGKEKYKEVSEGIARQSHRDRYNKWSGRKLALSRALSEFQKQDRFTFWQKYREEFGEERLFAPLPK
jgi:hypothetical protein